MIWDQARKKLWILSKGRRSAGGAALPLQKTASARGADRLLAVRASSLCIASGKGGTGKSVVTASLAALFADRGRTLLVDADFGVGNAHILQDVAPEESLVDVVDGSSSVREVLTRCAGQVDLLAAGCGVPHMADLSEYEMHLVASGLEDVERAYRFLLVDSAAGVSSQTRDLAVACDTTLVVTTPDLTAMTDAYAFLKVLLARRPDREPLLLVNRVQDGSQAEDVHARISKVTARFLGCTPRLVGWVPEDPAVVAAVNGRSSVVAHAPGSPAAAAFSQIAVVLLEEMGARHARGLGRTLLGSMAKSVRA